jgi:hypothetical protein
MSDEVFKTPRGEYTLQDLKDRVTAVGSHPVVRIHEVPRGTPDTLHLLSTIAVELGQSLDGERFGIIVDLIDADGAPTPDYRKAIPRCVKDVMTPVAHHVGIAWQGQPMARMAAKLLVRGLARNVTVHENFDEALAKVLTEIAK